LHYRLPFKREFLVKNIVPWGIRRIGKSRPALPRRLEIRHRLLVARGVVCGNGEPCFISSKGKTRSQQQKYKLKPLRFLQSAHERVLTFGEI
jgi:hypothetical protein